MSSSAQPVLLPDDTRSSLVRRWSVAELQNLSFGGDCNALAQYVEILVENFCDTDTSDLESLREHVRADLVDFIGADLARRFSDGLVKHLAEHADFLNRHLELDEPQPASSSDYVEINDSATVDESAEAEDPSKVLDVIAPATTDTSAPNVSEVVASVDDIKPADVANPALPTNHTKPVNLTEAVNPTELANLTKVDKPTELVNSTKPADPTKAANLTKTASPTTPASPTNSVLTNPAVTPDRVNPAESVAPVDTADAAGAVKNDASYNPILSDARTIAKAPKTSESFATPAERKVDSPRNGHSSSVAIPSPKQSSYDRNHVHRHVSRDFYDRQQVRPERDHRDAYHRDAYGQSNSGRLRPRDYQPSHRVKREPALQVYGDVRRDTRPSVMDRLGARQDSYARFPQRERDGSMNRNSFARNPQHTSARYNSSEREPRRNFATVDRPGLHERPDYRNREYHTYRDSRDRSYRQAPSSPGRRPQSVENVHDRLGPRPSQSLKRSREEDGHSPREIDAPASKRRSLDNDRRTQEVRPRQPSSLKRPRDEENYASREVVPPSKKRQSLESDKVEQTVRPRSPKRAVGLSFEGNKQVVPAVANVGAPQSKAPLLHPPMPTMEQMASSGMSWPFTPEMLSAMGMPPFFPIPPGHFPPVVSSNGMPLPPLQGAPFIPSAQPAGEKPTDATKKASGKPNPSGNSSNADSKHRHFILLAKNIPSESLMVGPIFAYFHRFGIVLDVVKAPPNKAFILFENRDSAHAALRSVEAVMGNRHISLAWARGSDFTEAGLTITHDGKLIERPSGPDQKNHSSGPAAAAPSGSTKRTGKSYRVDRNNDDSGKTSDQKAENKPSAKHVVGERGITSKSASNGLSADGSGIDLEAAADDLKRKREKIVAMRKEQEAQRAKRKERYHELVKAQKDLLAEIPSCTNEKQKLELVNKLRHMQDEALKIREVVKPSGPQASDSAAKTVSPGLKERVGPSTDKSTGTGESLTKGRKPEGTPMRPKYGRDLSTFQIDNRPKVLLVSGSVGVPEALAVAVFRETERVAKVEEGWLIELSSRRAAESAMRAIGPLKRGFGPDARAQIVSRSLPVSTGKQAISNGETSSASNRKKFSEAANAPPQAHWNTLGFKANASAGTNRGAAPSVTGDRNAVLREQVVIRPTTASRHGVAQTQVNPNPVAVENEGVQPFQTQQFGGPEGDPMMD